MEKKNEQIGAPLWVSAFTCVCVWMMMRWFFEATKGETMIALWVVTFYVDWLWDKALS